MIACTTPTVSMTCRNTHCAAPEVRVVQPVVIVGVGVGDAAAARRHVVEAALVERFHMDGDRARLRYLLGIDQPVRCPDLALLRSRPWTAVTTIGMTVRGFEMQATSPTIPTFITWASSWLNPATSLPRPASVGISSPAERMIGLTISPLRSVNCSSAPSTPARTMVLSSSTCAWARAASALAFLGRQQ